LGEIKNLFKILGEHLTESFGKHVNRFHKLPAINDNGFKLSESVAIFNYLGRKGAIPERWYPRDTKSLTKIDEYLQWQHNNLFMGAGILFYMQLVAPLRNGVLPSAEQIEFQKKNLVRNLNEMEYIWLHDTKFLTGNEITFADLMAASSIEQVVGMKLFKFEKYQHERVQKWLEEVRQYFGPTFKEAHRYVYKYGEKM
jgi:glutathione S-transferase